MINIERPLLFGIRSAKHAFFELTSPFEKELNRDYQESEAPPAQLNTLPPSVPDTSQHFYQRLGKGIALVGVVGLFYGRNLVRSGFKSLLNKYRNPEDFEFDIRSIVTATFGLKNADERNYSLREIFNIYKEIRIPKLRNAALRDLGREVVDTFKTSLITKKQKAINLFSAARRPKESIPEALEKGKDKLLTFLRFVPKDPELVEDIRDLSTLLWHSQSAAILKRQPLVASLFHHKKKPYNIPRFIKKLFLPEDTKPITLKELLETVPRYFSEEAREIRKRAPNSEFLKKYFSDVNIRTEEIKDDKLAKLVEKYNEPTIWTKRIVPALKEQIRKGKAPEGVIEALEQLPVWGIYKHPETGKIVDLRWATKNSILELLEKVKLPKGLSVPLIGDIGEARPLRGLASLLTPIGLLRRQRHLEILKNQQGKWFLKLATGEVGKNENEVWKLNLEYIFAIQKYFLKKGKLTGPRTELGSLKSRIKFSPRLSTWKISDKVKKRRKESDIDPNAPYSIYKLLGPETKRDIVAKNIHVVPADTSVGKGASIRGRGYKHSLTQFLREHGIVRDSKLGNLLKFGDIIGIGPHLTSPVIFSYKDYFGLSNTSVVNPDNLKVVKSKPGVLQRLFEWSYEKGFGKKFKLFTGKLNVIESREKDIWSDLEKSSWTSVSGATLKEPFRPLQGISDWTNYLLLRPLALFEEVAGIGIKPYPSHRWKPLSFLKKLSIKNKFLRDLANKSEANLVSKVLGGRMAFGRPVPSPMKSIYTLLTRIALPGYALYQTLRYIDYKLHDIAGISPFDEFLNTYAGIKIAWAGIYEALGIRKVSEEAEETFPGIISSPLSYGVRTYLGALLGAKIGGKLTDNRTRGFMKFIPAIGAALGAMALGSDLTKGPRELAEIYSGERWVPVRKGRFWEAGRTSYAGDKVSYYRPHFIAKRRSRAEEKAIYGSEENYWKYGTWLPTPENLFGLRPLLNPYYAAERNLYLRPYPIIKPDLGIEKIPIVGPLLNMNPITNALFKTYTHPLKDFQEAGYMPPYVSSFQFSRNLPRNVPVDISQRLGLEQPEYIPPETLQPRSIRANLHKEKQYLTDWLGLPGFIYESTLGKVFGGDITEEGAYITEPSTRLTSTSRWFHDSLNIGGGLTYSEFFRRMIPREKASTRYYNMVPNYAPSWLPGSRSVFPEDRDYYLDFHTGDYMTKIKEGEIRLPGPGYEAVRPLHSGRSGVYDPVDRYLILANVAPFSKAFKHYQTIVSSWQKEGLLDPFWQKQVALAQQQIEEKMKSRLTATPNLMYAPELTEVPVTVEKVTYPGYLYTKEFDFPIALAGINYSMNSAAGKLIADANASTIQEAKQKISKSYRGLKERLKLLEGETINIQIARDEAARYKDRKLLAIVPGINEQYIDSEIGDEDQLGIAAHLRAGSIRRTLGNIYYGIASQRVPPPLGWAKNKLLPIRSPLDEYIQFEAQMPKVALWDKPIEHFIKPWINETIDFFTPGDYLPRSFRERQRITTDFQALDYMKLLVGEQMSYASGDYELAKVFAGKAQRNVFGMNLNNPRDVILGSYSAAGPVDKKYLSSFEELQTTEERLKALHLVSPGTKAILAAKYKSHIPKSQVIDYSQYQNVLDEYTNSKYQESLLASAQEDLNIPSPNWAGWDPRVNTRALQVRYLDSIGEDIHSYGLWESDYFNKQRYFPDVELPHNIFQGIKEVDQIGLEFSRRGARSIALSRNNIGLYNQPVRLEYYRNRTRDYEQAYSSYQHSYGNNRIYSGSY